MSLRRIDGDIAEKAVTIISILKSISTLFGKEFVEQYIPFEADWDTVHHMYYTAINLCTDKQRDLLLDDCGSFAVGLVRNEMTEYYSLAYRFSELKGLTDRENAYLWDSFKCFNDTFGRISHYSFGCKLCVNSRKKPRLVLIFSPEYYPNAEVIYNLYKFFGFFDKMLPLLQSELAEIERKTAVKKVPNKKVNQKSKRRNKAA